MDASACSTRRRTSIAWESRGNQRYFYRSVRRGGRVHKEYYGRGLLAEHADLLLEDARVTRAEDAASLLVVKKEYESRNRIMIELDTACRDLTEATLRAAGFRKMANYEWRRTMRAVKPMPPIELGPLRPEWEKLSHASRVSPDGAPCATEPTQREDVLSLDTRIGQAPQIAEDPVLPHPAVSAGVSEATERAGDLGLAAERCWLNLIAGSDRASRETLARKVTAMRAEIAGPNPTPLESILAARIVATLLQIAYVEREYTESSGTTGAHANLIEKQLDAAHRRNLSAITALSKVRRSLGIVAPAQVDLPRLTLVGEHDSDSVAHTCQPSQVSPSAMSTVSGSPDASRPEVKIEDSAGATESPPGTVRSSRRSPRRSRVKK